MKVSTAVFCLALASPAAAFAPMVPKRSFVMRPLQMSEETVAPKPTPPAVEPEPAAAAAPSGGALVPIKEETVEFTAGLIGGVAGFAVGGPVFGAIAAAIANYVSKTDGDVADVVQAVSKSSIQVFNYLSSLDSKYEFLNKAQTSLENALENLKSQEKVDKAAVAKVEDALAKTQKKIAEINDEYDLVGGSMTALGVVGDLVEKAIKKAGELNDEYKLTEKAQDALKSAVNKAKASASA